MHHDIRYDWLYSKIILNFKAVEIKDDCSLISGLIQILWHAKVKSFTLFNCLVLLQIENHLCIPLIDWLNEIFWQNFHFISIIILLLIFSIYKNNIIVLEKCLYYTNCFHSILIILLYKIEQIKTLRERVLWKKSNVIC